MLRCFLHEICACEVSLQYYKLILNCLTCLFSVLESSHHEAPHLEYSSAVWSPYYQNEIQLIEAIQRKFIRFALRHLRWNNPHNLHSYRSSCKLINLNLLEDRRNVAKCCFIGDLLQGNIDCAFNQCYRVFDLNMSRVTNKCNFREILC